MAQTPAEPRKLVAFGELRNERICRKAGLEGRPEDGKILLHELFGPIVVRRPDVQVDQVDLELPPPSCRHHAQHVHPSCDVSDLAVPGFHRQRPPRRVEGLCTRSDVFYEFRRRFVRTSVDLRSPTRVASGILLHDLTMRRGLRPSAMTVGVAGDMGEHVSHRPAGQKARGACRPVVKPNDCRLESGLRVEDQVEVACRNRGVVARRCVICRGGERTRGSSRFRPASSCLQVVRQSSGWSPNRADPVAKQPLPSVSVARSIRRPPRRRR
jgi:hypothetical protein